MTLILIINKFFNFSLFLASHRVLRSSKIISTAFATTTTHSATSTTKTKCEIETTSSSASLTMLASVSNDNPSSRIDVDIIESQDEEEEDHDLFNEAANFDELELVDNLQTLNICKETSLNNKSKTKYLGQSSDFKLTETTKEKKRLHSDGFYYVRDGGKNKANKEGKIYWKCEHYDKAKCKARVHIIGLIRESKEKQN